MMFNNKTKFINKTLNLFKKNIKNEMKLNRFSTINFSKNINSPIIGMNHKIGSFKIKRNYSTAPNTGSNATNVANTVATPSTNTNIITDNLEKVVDTTNAAKVVSTTSSWTGPIDMVQMALEYIVETQHVPFYLAIVGFTMGVRILIAPLSVMSYKNIIFSIKYAPVIRNMTNKIRDAAQTGGEARELAMREFKQWKIDNDYKPIRSLIPIIVQVPIFLCVFFAIRRFAYDIQPEEFINGGISWFKDLSKSDPYWRFPAVSALLSFLASEKVDATPKHHKGPLRLWLTRGAIGMGFFVSGWFPCGMQIYWLTSNFFTFLINAILYTDSVRKFFKIPSKQEINEIEAPPSMFFQNPYEKPAPTKPAVDPKKAARLMKQRTKAATEKSDQQEQN